MFVYFYYTLMICLDIGSALRFVITILASAEPIWQRIPRNLECMLVWYGKGIGLNIWKFILVKFWDFLVELYLLSMRTLIATIYINVVIVFFYKKEVDIRKNLSKQDSHPCLLSTAFVIKNLDTRLTKAKRS